MAKCCSCPAGPRRNQLIYNYNAYVHWHQTFHPYLDAKLYFSAQKCVCVCVLFFILDHLYASKQEALLGNTFLFMRKTFANLLFFV